MTDPTLVEVGVVFEVGALVDIGVMPVDETF
jgi:hypothetical protein